MSQIVESTNTPAPPQSNVIDTDNGSTSLGGGTPSLSEPVEPTAPVKGETPRDSLANILKEMKNSDAKEASQEGEEKAAKDAKEEKPVKAEKPVKPEKSPRPENLEKHAKAVDQASQEYVSDDTEQNPTEKSERSGRDGDERQDRQSGGRDRPEPPARFLPKAKEVWRNVPQAVQSEVARMQQDHEQELNYYRESHQFREELKEYEELGRVHGTTVKDAIGNYVKIEQTLHSNPGEGFKQILNNMGMKPNEAIGHILKAYGVSPQQLAQHMAQQPNQYAPQQRQQAPMPQPPQDDARVRQLEQTIYSMQQQQVENSIIQPFVAEHPRYYELENDIAMFLHSGKVPSNLSPIQRLEVAYDMAERINPSSNVAESKDYDSRVDSDSNGRKSVKSAPGNLSERREPQKKMSTREVLEDEIQRMKRR